MIKCLVKRWIVSKINHAISSHMDDVDKSRSIVTTWTERLERLLVYVKTINTYLDDGKIDGDEIECAVKDINKIVKEW